MKNKALKDFDKQFTFQHDEQKENICRVWEGALDSCNDKLEQH